MITRIEIWYAVVFSINLLAMLQGLKWYWRAEESNEMIISGIFLVIQLSLFGVLLLVTLRDLL